MIELIAIFLGGYFGGGIGAVVALILFNVCESLMSQEW